MRNDRVKYVGLISPALAGLVLVGGLMVLFPVAGYSQAQVDQKKIDEAIDKGVKFLLDGKQVQEWLRGKMKTPYGERDVKELVVLTLLHAGVSPKKNGQLAEAVNQLTASELKNTYNVALTAMALEIADRSTYQYRIAQCAQALVNYQCKNGQWSYPSKYEPNQQGQPKVTGSPAEEKETVTEPGVTRAVKALKKVVVERRNPKGGEKGDNSNTQFALLGLRAAARCGVEIPKETWQDAAKWLEQNQFPSGGWAYGEYEIGKAWSQNPYGSMTCACLCGLAIAKFYLGQDIHKDATIEKGLKYLGEILTFTGNPGHGFCHYYYIYGVERVGAVLGTEQIGNHEWYPEGVDYLLKAQQADGSWSAGKKDDWTTSVICDTCFAILFLKRATQKLIPKVTGEGK